MKRYDITVKGKPYKAKDGSEKFTYKNVGTLIEGVSDKTGKPYKILELNMFPGVDFSIFEQKPKVDTGYGEVENPPIQLDDNKPPFTYEAANGEVVNAEDIPF